MARGRGRPPKRVPDLWRRKDGRLYVTDPATGKQVRLADEQAYEDWRRAFLERSPERPAKSKPLPAGGKLTVAQLCDAYLDYAESYYVKDGEPTGHLGVVEQSIRQWVILMADEPVNTMRPGHAEQLQEQMIGRDMARSTINKYMQCIRGMLRWGIRKEVVDPMVLERVKSVPALKKGRTAARETPPVQPVELERIKTVESQLSKTLRTMVWVQYYGGMRPGETCRLCAVDLDTSGELWEYLPARWKTEHHEGQPRRVFLGPRAQEILRPFLSQVSDPKRPFFFTEKIYAGRRRPYTTRLYGLHLRRACRRAGVTPFAPNTLRHAAGTEIRKRFGAEAAQVFLGHAHLRTTEIYAVRDVELAKKVAAAMG